MRNDRSRILYCLLTLVLFCSAVFSAPLTRASPIHLRGVGEILIGMTMQEARKTTGQTFTQEFSGGEERGCHIYRIQGIARVSFMLTNGRISRIEILNPMFKTISGIGVGDSQRAVLQKYAGRVTEEKEHYTRNPLFVYNPKDAADQSYRIKFYCENGTIRSITVGKIPEVNYVEGCL